MSTTASARTRVVVPTAGLRRNAVLLIVAFGLFVIGILPAMFGSPERFIAEENAAIEAGVGVRELPGSVLSEIARQYSSAGLEVLFSLPAIIAMVLFSIAVIRSVRGTGRVGVLGAIAAVTAAAAFIADILFFVGLYAEPGSLTVLVDNFELLNKVAIAVAVMAGCIAVIVLALILRRAGVATRTGVVVIVLAALAFVAAPIPAVGGMPPALTVLLGFVLAIPMLGSTRRVRQ